MPNGGTDNCGTCSFNKVNQGKWGCPESKPEKPDTAFCTIRKIPIPDPFYTYCLKAQTKQHVAEGPVFSTGLASPYSRIPWFENRPAQTVGAGR